MRICGRWMQEGTTDRCGRSHSPQCTTSREDRQIVRMAVTDRSVTSQTVAQHTESVTHHSVSARTIRRRLQQSGLSARRPLLGLPLTQNHRRLPTRGLLATDHVILNHGQVTWTTPELAPPLLTTTPHQQEDVSALDRFNVHRCPTRQVFSGTGLELVTRQATVRYLYHSATAAVRMWATEWNEVVFTDESRICLQHHDGRIRVWKHRGEKMLNSCVMHRHTGPALDIMVWGGIGYHSRTLLVRITGTLNSQRHISEVLEPVVLPYLQGLATAIFQQDNARSHVARIVQRFFVNHKIELLPWPARSPDLSPIENMWSMFAQRLTQITPPAATPDQLWQCVEAVWSAVPQEHIQSLFESMPRRVAAVISNNGSYSGY
ncbi:transposable element Tcb1 transposase [Trichonephila clavipes]|nr:transposable element Tcb1 transposase [Trichonephila clavipes]